MAKVDRALVKDDLLDIWGVPRSKILVSEISDHMPIVLSWKSTVMNKGIPYKFNRVWLEDVDYVKLVFSTWKEEVGFGGLGLMECFHHKLHNLKQVSKKWEVKKKAALKNELLEINRRLDTIYNGFTDSYPDVESYSLLNQLVLRKKYILRIEETT